MRMNILQETGGIKSWLNKERTKEINLIISPLTVDRIMGGHTWEQGFQIIISLQFSELPAYLLF